jgi:predicted flap endonuclease-1-like 5' DNA nuclease
MDRSTRTLTTSFLWVAALFVAMNTIVASSSPGDWAFFVVLVVVGAVVLYYPEQGRMIEETSPAETEKSLIVAAPKAIIEHPAAQESVSESPTHEEEIVETESRSDALAAVAEPSAEELEDSVENVSVATDATLEETGELSGPPTDSHPRRATSEIPAAPVKPDDLTVIEGIGPKMSAALAAAGIDTYAKLAAASEDMIREAISAAGMRFAPSLVTWAEQAAYAAKGDWDGLKTFTDSLTAGRRGS